MRFTAALRRLRLGLTRALGRLTLSQRFLAVAFVVVSLAVVALGHLTVLRLQESITRGVAIATASSIDALVERQFAPIDLSRPLDAAEAAEFRALFEMGSEGDPTRLLQIQLFDLEGNLRFAASDGFANDRPRSADFAAAAAGQVVARVSDARVGSLGPVPDLPLTVLKILTPLDDRDGKPRGVARLYYSATSLLELFDEARLQVWLIVGSIGAAVIGVLYLLVDRWSRTISEQRRRLQDNLHRSRHLSAENRALHAASEKQRLEAGFANESLLAKVGSDIHDGPIQMLTLIILRLTGRNRGASTEAADKATVQLATDAMEELRNISTGLILPELSELTLRQVLELAASRHEDATGTRVAMRLGRIEEPIPLEVRICAYRVVQEALTNAYRHAGAAGQEVAAETEPGMLKLTVSNSVKPSRRTAPPPQPDANAGLGLRGMRFRVESLGGTLAIDLANARRTSVTAHIPYRSEARPSGGSMPLRA